MGPGPLELPQLRGVGGGKDPGPDGVQQLRRAHLLGGSGVVIGRVISRVTILITHIRGLITPLITTPEPPIRESRMSESVCKSVCVPGSFSVIVSIAMGQ